MNRRFSDFDDKSSKFMDQYKYESDPIKALDLTHVKDDPNLLMEELAKQPAMYAYWSNLRLKAERQYDGYVSKFDLMKSRYKREVLERLKTEGNSKPNAKVVEQKYEQMYKDCEWWIKYNKVVKLWKRRKEDLTIIEKAMAERSNSLKSMGYLVSHMMQSGLIKQV